MRCHYCLNRVVGKPNIVILKGIGPAHYQCYENNRVHSRVFGDLDLQTLNDDALNELKEMVLSECNSRKLMTEEEAVELFS